MKTKKVKKFSKAIKKFLKRHGRGSNDRIKNFNRRVIIDKKRLQFLLVHSYWIDKRYVYRVCIHFEIIGNKISVVTCNMDVNIEKEFNYLGILAKHITSSDTEEYLRDIPN